MEKKTISKKQREQIWENSNKICSMLFAWGNWINVIELYCPDFTRISPSGKFITTKESMIEEMRKCLLKASKCNTENMHITDYNNWDKDGNLLDDKGNIVWKNK